MGILQMEYFKLLHLTYDIWIIPVPSAQEKNLATSIGVPCRKTHFQAVLVDKVL